MGGGGGADTVTSDLVRETAELVSCCYGAVLS